MGIEKIVNNGIETTGQIAKKILPKHSVSSNIIQGGEKRIISTLDALANQGAAIVKKVDKEGDGARFKSFTDSSDKGRIIEIEFDERYGRKNTFLTPKDFMKIIGANPIKTNLSSKRNVFIEIFPKLNELQKKDPQKAQYVQEIITQLLQFKTKTKAGVSDEYARRFIEKLMDMDTVLLKNICDNKIPISIYDDVELHRWNRVRVLHAGYMQRRNGMAKELQFCERNLGFPPKKQGKEISTIESMAHELGHAYDFNNGKKLNLTQQRLSVINDDNNLRFINLPSMSKEFDKAFACDFDNMLEIDKKLGKREGSTFDELLQNPSFSYYLGVPGKKIEGLCYNDIKARKELYAQMVSYITTGKVTEIEFQERIEELFPNLLDFARKTLQK